MTARFVICGGLARSASTLQYNVVRDILRARGYAVDHGYTKLEADVRAAVDAFDGSRDAVIKTHEYFPFFAGLDAARGFRVLSSTRRIHEVIVSSMRAYNASFAYLDERGVIDNELMSLVGYAALPGALVQRYERLTTDLAACVREIATFLDVELTPAGVEDLAERFGIDRQLARMAAWNRTPRARVVQVVNTLFKALNPTKRRPNGLILSRDPVTGLHWNHISPDRGRVDVARALTPEQIDRIDAAVRAAPLAQADRTYHLHGTP